MKKTDLVVTSNQYVEAKYTLGLNEEKIIYCAMLTAREMKRDYDHETFIEVRATDFGMLTGLENREAYRALRLAAGTLKKRFVLFNEPDPVTGKPSVLEVPLTSGVRYVEDAGLIRLRFTKEIIPHFTQLVDGNFTQHEIGYLAKLSSIYATRLYRLLHKDLWKGGVVTFDIEYLREVLQLGNKYERIENLKAKVIDVAVKQINEHTELRVTYQNIKIGRVVTGLEFTVKDTSATPTPKTKKPSTSKSKTPNTATFAGRERMVFMALQHDFDFITEEYVRDMMSKWGSDDAIQTMDKLREEMSPENFVLKKTD